MRLQFTVLGNPVSKARPRMTRSGRAYTPAATLEHEERIAQAAIAVIPADWDAGHDYRLSATFYMATKRPTDVDNAYKAVGDALNGVLYYDDSQVVEIHGWRDYDRQNPRTVIAIESIDVSSAEATKRRLAYETKLAKRAAKKRKATKPKRLTRKRKSR